MLEPKILDYLIHQLGRLEIDMFASTLTKQILIHKPCLPDPESSTIDAFAINWNNILSYAFQNFNIIWRVLQKIQEECRKTIVTVPLWTIQSWFTRIMELAVSLPIIISSRQLKLPGTKEKHPLYPKLQMLGLLISNQFHLQHQFCQMHKQLYQQHRKTKAKYNSTFKRCLPCDIINYSTVSTLLKCACNLRSLTPKYFTIWDVNTLLSHIQHKDISAFHEIIKKLATLFMILAGT